MAPHQVEEVTKAVFHTILLHRTTGKVSCKSWCKSVVSSLLVSPVQYSYSSQHSGTFSVGVIGMEDVDLSSLNFTYVSLLVQLFHIRLDSRLFHCVGSLCIP